MTELEQLPGWESLVAAGTVGPPTPGVLDASVAAVRRTAQEEMGPPAGPARSRVTRRRALGLGLAAAAVAAVLAIVLPVVLPPGGLGSPRPATAAAAERLALAAATPPPDRLRPDEFRYVVVDQRQLMEGEFGLRVGRREQWIAADGRRWERLSSPGSDTIVNFFPARADGGFAAPGPGALTDLPREPHELVHYLSSRVSGSSSKEEAIFVALADLLHSDLADSPLRATMFRAMGLLPHVAVDDNAVDARGRHGVELIWDRPHTKQEVRQTMTFDPANARLLEESSSYTYDTPLQPHSSRTLSDVTTVTANRVVASVPPDVLRRARHN